MITRVWSRKVSIKTFLLLIVFFISMLGAISQTHAVFNNLTQQV